MPRQKSKIAQLEGLRGVAAFVVLLGHIRLTLFVEPAAALRESLPTPLAWLFESGFDGDFAVWTFWVMSAVVLSLRFFETACPDSARTSLTDSAIRRYPRLLLPVLVSVAFAWLLHSFGLMTNRGMAASFGAETYRWLDSFYTFDASFLDAARGAFWDTFFNYDEETTYNAVLWTMEKELYGSLFLFAFLALAGKHHARIVFYVASALALHLLSLHWLNAFTAGIAICDVYVHRDALARRVPPPVARLTSALLTGRLGTAAAIAAAPVVLVLVGAPNFKEVFHLLLATAVTVFALVSEPASRFFSKAPLVFLGKISFGLYLAHLPIICAIAQPTFSLASGMAGPTGARALTAGVLLVASLAGGWLLWYIGDRPAIAFSRKVANTLKAKPSTTSP